MKGRQETTGEPSAAALLDLEAASKALADFEAPTSDGGTIDFTDWLAKTQREYRRLQT